MNYL
jgi:hypothetical protein